MTSRVTEIAAATPSDALAHYRERLSRETDCWDVHDALSRGVADFVLLDVRSTSLYEASHIPGSVSLPHGKMSAHRLSQWPDDTLFVVYCAGPHCNGTDKAAVRLAEQGRRMKVMIGGMTGWADEGFDFAAGPTPDQKPPSR